jgi:hypothetical protein
MTVCLQNDSPHIHRIFHSLCAVVETGKQIDVFSYGTTGKVRSMDKGARNVKKPDIYSNMIPIYYLSKVTGLAPLSPAYTPDKHSRVGARLKILLPGVLYTVLMIMGIIEGQCVALILYATDTRTNVTEGTKYVFLSQLIIREITSVTSLAIGLTRIRKQIDTLLYKVFVVDTLIGTRSDILRRNDRYLRMQVTLLITVLSTVYVNDFVASNFGFNVWLCVAIVYYICTSIQFVTIIHFVNLVS